MTKQKDPVDRIVDQWKVERPDLATSAMATLGRLKRCSVLYQPFLDSLFAQFDLSSWEFDVLATLRRAGKPYRLSPTELFSTLMVTSGTMTHRLKSLINKQLIVPVQNQNDARNKLVQLTPGGLELIENAMTAHADNLEYLLTDLSKEEHDTLDQSLKTLLAIFESLHKKHETVHSRLSSKMHSA